MIPFGIIPPREPITDKNGNVTRIWWRFLNSLFTSVGSGQATETLTEVQATQFAMQGTSGPDYGRGISDLQTTLFALAGHGGSAGATTPSQVPGLDDLTRWVGSLPQTPRDPGLTRAQGSALVYWGF